MKNYAVLAALAAAAFAVPAQAEEVFTVINKTGYDIAEVYIAPSRSNDWEEDILGQDVLTDGARTNIDFAKSEDTCNWDMKVVYTDGDNAAWQGLNLCEILSVELHYNASTGKTSALTE
ncbi:argininosuccinate lyase [Novosphingobium sp. PS1R-30]|uniref:Argininosuccinate lyase n=1 Tax=Novosphingobium anseongense TaxID=3133436 RepID=A0ABU8RRR6_9SPHN